MDLPVLADSEENTVHSVIEIMLSLGVGGLFLWSYFKKKTQNVKEANLELMVRERDAEDKQENFVIKQLRTYIIQRQKDYVSEIASAQKDLCELEKQRELDIEKIARQDERIKFLEQEVFDLRANQKILERSLSPGIRMYRCRILMIEDDRKTIEIYQDLLEPAGYEVDSCTNGIVALQKLSSFKPDLIILDLKLPNMSGKDALRYIKEIRPDVPIIVHSGYTEQLDAEDKKLIASILSKPVKSVNDLLVEVGRLLKDKQ